MGPGAGGRRSADLGRQGLGVCTRVEGVSHDCIDSPRVSRFAWADCGGDGGAICTIVTVGDDGGDHRRGGRTSTAIGDGHSDDGGCRGGGGGDSCDARIGRRALTLACVDTGCSRCVGTD